MGDLSRSADGTGHGNTIVLPKVRIYFQVFPGIDGTSKDRGIAGVEYKGKIGKTMFFVGVTDEFGCVEIGMPAGETATLEIFNTEYLVSAKTSVQDVTTTEGTQERLSLLGYYTGKISGNLDAETDLALLNYQADRSLNANGCFSGSIDTTTQDDLKKVFGE